MTRLSIEISATLLYLLFYFIHKSILSSLKEYLKKLSQNNVRKVEYTRQLGTV